MESGEKKRREDIIRKTEYGITRKIGEKGHKLHKKKKEKKNRLVAKLS